MPRALARWDPFAELSKLRARLDPIFDEWPLIEGRARGWMPAIDVVRDDGNLVVRADVPGTKPEEVKIEVEAGILTISGQHEEHTEEQHKHYLRHERRCGSFSRSIALPADIDAEQIKATTHDGIVEVTVPLPKQVSKKTITITPTAG
jgi:HSP20 family protein